MFMSTIEQQHNCKPSRSPMLFVKRKTPITGPIHRREQCPKGRDRAHERSAPRNLLHLSISHGSLGAPR